MPASALISENFVRMRKCLWRVCDEVQNPKSEHSGKILWKVGQDGKSQRARRNSVGVWIWFRSGAPATKVTTQQTDCHNRPAIPKLSIRRESTSGVGAGWVSTIKNVNEEVPQASSFATTRAMTGSAVSSMLNVIRASVKQAAPAAKGLPRDDLPNETRKSVPHNEHVLGGAGQAENSSASRGRGIGGPPKGF